MLQKPRTRRPKAPKPVPPPRAHRPKRGDLRIIYRDLISASRDQRIAVLAKAMTWYDHVIAYLAYKQKGEWGREQLQHKNLAEKARAIGITVTESKRKETEYRVAVAHYEEMLNGWHPPKLNDYLTILQTKSKRLEERKAKLKDKYGDFLSMMQTALQSKNADGKRVELTIDRINVNYRIDSEGNVTFDRKVVENLRKVSRRQGMLAAVIQMLPVLSEAAARVQERDPQNHLTGRYVIQDGKRYRATLEMLNCLNQWALSEQGPKRLVRKPKPPKEETIQ